MNDSIILSKAVIEWGIESQVMMAIEEMGELIQALSKRYRGIENYKNVCEEIADVEIMMAQLRIIFDDKNMIDDIKNKKLKRLNGLLNKKKEK